MIRKILTAALLAACATNSMGQAAPHQIDMTVVLKDDNGKPVKDLTLLTKDDPDCVKCGPLTLGHAAAHALFAIYPDEQNLDGMQRWGRGVLAERIKDATAAELTAEEVAVIKRLMGKYYNGMILVQAYPALDPNMTPPTVQ